MLFYLMNSIDWASFACQLKVKCAFCLQEHSHQDCKKVSNISESKQLIRKYGRCFVCLKKRHIWKNCLSKNNFNACRNRQDSSICESTGATGDCSVKPCQFKSSQIVGTDSRNEESQHWKEDPSCIFERNKGVKGWGGNMAILKDRNT